MEEKSNQNTKMFSKLKTGNYFNFNDGIYIKINNAKDNDNNVINAVNLKNGTVSRIKAREIVTPIDYMPGEWISTKDDLPKEGRTVMAYRRRTKQYIFCSLVGKNWYNKNTTVTKGAISHWMPLPVSPEEE